MKVGLFSKRRGIVPARVTVQTYSVDEPLRTKLWNCMCFHGLSRLSESDRDKSYRDHNTEYLVSLYHSFFNWPVDTIPDYRPEAYNKIREYFFKCKWYSVYDFIEFSLRAYPNGLMTSSVDCLNNSLEEEMAGYRIIDGLATPITSKEEIHEIEQAITSGMGPVKEQLEKALALFSDRSKPNFADSVKNSVSAVESLCVMIADDGSKTLPKSLARVEERIHLRKALSSSLNSLYGYRNVEPGVGHGGPRSDEVTFDEAKLFLVLCSAWVNYLLSKVSKEGIRLRT